MNPKASLALGILCIAFSPIFVKLSGAPALTSAFYRIFIGWLCLAPWCIFTHKLKIKRADLLVAILGGLIFGADIAVWHLSLSRIGATVSTLVANLAPVWVGLFTYILFKKSAGLLFWAGTIAALAGMVVLVGYQDVLSLHFSSGILLALLASVFYAMYIMLTKGIVQRIEILTFMFYNMLAASIFLLAICGAQHNELITLAPRAWLSFLGLGAICQVAGWLTINYSLRFLNPARVSIALLAQTVLAAFLAAWLLNEHLDFKQIAGSLIVLAGIAVSFLKKNGLPKGELLG
jgi:drug/metabolite transporter (DMT)-like permease